MWETIANTIGSVAPTVGTLLGGPMGGAAGSLIASVLGVENTPQAIESELKNNPDAMIKIKKLESDERVKNLNLYYGDKDSARSREVNIQTSKDWLVRNTGSMIAIFTLVSAVIMDGYLLYLAASGGEINAIYTLIAGGTSVRAVQVLSFYFGDSKSTADTSRGKWHEHS